MSASVSLKSLTSDQTAYVETSADGGLVILQFGTGPGANVPLTCDFLTVQNGGQRIVMSPTMAGAIRTVLQAQ